MMRRRETRGKRIPPTRASVPPRRHTQRRKGGAQMEQIKILGFAGSLRSGSYNRGLIRAAVELAPPGTTVEMFELGDIPLYNQDIQDQGDSPAVAAFKTAIAAADALLVATPEYNHCIPGVLKNALDWASRPRATSPLRDKPVAILGATPGPGATARAQANLREAFVFVGAVVMPLPEVLVASATQHFDADGNLTDPEIRASIVELVEALARWTVRLSSDRAA